MKLDHTANGVYAIAATPFKPDGAVDTESVDRMTDFYLSCGVTGLTILGIMGEAPKLDPAEALAISHQVVRRAKVPVIVDAGVGTASDAAIAMELGCGGVLMNTAIAEAKDPVRMAEAMKHAVIAGRFSYLAGRMPKKRYADPSSPLAGLI